MNPLWWIVALAPLWGFGLFILIAGLIFEMDDRRAASSQDTKGGDDG